MASLDGARQNLIMRLLQHHPTWLYTLTILAITGFLMLWLRLPPTLRAIPHPGTLFDIIPLHPNPVLSPARLLPHDYWNHRCLHPEAYNQISCAKFPQLHDIHYAAASWQHLQVKNGSVYMYGAYWDDRFEEPLVRVLVYCDVTPLPKLHCLLWYYDDNAPETVTAEAMYGWRSEWGGPTDGVNEPWVVACGARRHPPDAQAPPRAVSLVLEPCDTPANVLNVQGTPTGSMERHVNTSSIGSCLKWLHYHNDVSAALIEWAQLLRHFGADKLYVYVVQVHPNVRRVLDYYVGTGYMEVTELAHPPQLRAGARFPGSARDFYDMRRELLPLNDCLYRAVRRHAWITVFDMDEIIVPVRDGTWQKLIDRESLEANEPLDALVCSNFYLLDSAQKKLEAPEYTRMLGHLWRARNPSPPGYHVKSFHNTSSVVAMHNHYPMSCGARDCVSRDVNESRARLHHYRERCDETAAGECDAMRDTVRDDTMRRWRRVLTEVNRILKELGITPR